MAGRATGLALILIWLAVAAVTGVFLATSCEFDCGDAGGSASVALMALATGGAIWGAFKLSASLPPARRLGAGLLAAAAFALILGLWLWVSMLH